VIHGAYLAGGDAADASLDAGELSGACRRLAAAVLQANASILSRATADPSLAGMGAAVVAVAREADSDEIAIVHVGDVRGYWMHGGTIEQITEDDTVVRKLVRDGKLQPEDVPASPYRHVLTQALGSGDEVRPTVGRVRPESGDVLIVCSDGLHDLVDAADIARIVGTGTGDLEDRCQGLIDLALERGGHDNTTVLLLSFEREREATASDHPGGRPARPAAPEIPGWAYLGLGTAVVLGGGLFFLAPRSSRRDGAAPPIAVPSPAATPQSTVPPTAATLPTEGRPRGEEAVATTPPIAVAPGITAEPDGAALAGERAVRGGAAATPVRVVGTPPGELVRQATGQPLELGVTVGNGTESTFRYEWRRNGRVVAGADQPRCSVPDPKDGDEFSVIVTGPDGGTATRRWRISAPKGVRAGRRQPHRP